MPSNHNSSNAKYAPTPNGDIEMNKMALDHNSYTPDGVGKGGGGGGKDPKELRIYYKGESQFKRRTKLEKYLMVLCLILFVASVAFLIIALTRDSKAVPYCLSNHCVKTAAQLLDAIDPEVDPCEDFYQFACGAWNKKYIIPEDKPSYNTFEKLQDELLGKLKKILEDEQANDYDTNATLKAKILYHSCIDTDQIEQVGDKPLRHILDELGSWPVVTPNWEATSWDLIEVLASMRGLYNAPILIDTWVAADDKNSSVNIIQLDQPSLGMMSREYFLDDSESKYKDAYLRYMISIAELLGANHTHAVKEMTEVLNFEVKLANMTMANSERHDTMELYTKITIKELQEQVPEVDWLRYFNGFVPVTITENEKTVSFAMDYLRKMGKLVEHYQKHNKRVLANYLLWRLILGLAPELTEKYQWVRTEYRKVLMGTSRDRGRWQKCVEYVNEKLGMAVGRLFIRENFRQHSKEVALEMIHNIREAFNEILEESSWMDAETKAAAKEKANAINERIGYPEFILETELLDKKYDNLWFNKSTYFENILRVEKYESFQKLKQLREPVKKGEMDQEPAVVNAYYNPNTNDIVFPAAILQPLFYSEFFPKSLNYGGIGVVIGHEITHGFDDKGRQYDKNGNMRQWWNNATISKFRERAQCIVDQYSGYKLEPFGHQIDGKNTQGENIADNGGLKESYRAYKKWVARNGEELPLPGIDLTHDQLFFLNYAQIWCGIMRTEEALHKVRTSVHSPGPIRVLGPLSNSKDFAAAYNCPLGSRMNPEKKCSVW